MNLSQLPDEVCVMNKDGYWFYPKNTCLYRTVVSAEYSLNPNTNTIVWYYHQGILKLWFPVIFYQKIQLFDMKVFRSKQQMLPIVGFLKGNSAVCLQVLGSTTVYKLKSKY